MGKVVALPREVVDFEHDTDAGPYLVRDAYGNEAHADSESAALRAAYQLQRDHADAMRTQGSGSQSVVIWYEGTHVLTINRRIRHEEVYRA